MIYWKHFVSFILFLVFVSAAARADESADFEWEVREELGPYYQVELQEMERQESEEQPDFSDQKNIIDRFIRKKFINFGVVKSNSNYQIYRSGFLGAKGLYMVKGILKKKGLPFPKTIIYMNKQGYLGKIPIIGKFALEEYFQQEKMGFRFFHSFDRGNRTYLDGDNPFQPSEDIDNQRYVLGPVARGLFGSAQDGKKDGDAETYLKILKIILESKGSPILFHCLGGKHRTGMVALGLRYLEGGNWIAGYKKKIRTKQGTFMLNPAQYEYYKYNKNMFKKVNLEFVEKISQDPRFQDLIVKYHTDLQ